MPPAQSLALPAETKGLGAQSPVEYARGSPREASLTWAG
jgi:hypothetical protein